MAKTRYIALLRGINVGGNKKIKMADLRAMFAALGFEKTKTALASGNIAFDAVRADPDALKATVERGIEATFGFSASVIVMPQEQVQALVASDPFAGVEVTDATRLYVTFLPEPRPTMLTIPHRVPANDFTLLRVTDTEVCSVLTLVPGARTTEAMAILEREFGDQITTRNWNTVLKLAEL